MVQPEQHICQCKPIKDTTDHRGFTMLKVYRKLVAYYIVVIFIYGCLIHIPRSPYSGRFHQDVDHKNGTEQTESGPVYVIMPTYKRSNQRSLLVMQTQVLAGARGIHLILTEEALTHTEWIRHLLEESKLNFTHLTMRARGKSCHQRNCAKGSSPRNTALQWLKETNVTHGVIYFADDDNFYDVKLFDEIKKTRAVSIFPVGGFLRTWISTPVIKNSSIVDFLDSWKGKRRWPLDMAGFAVSVQHWLKQGGPIFDGVKGYLETRFMERLNITRNTVEILASGATKIYVWHNSLKSVSCSNLSGTIRKAAGWKDTNLQQLKKYFSCL